MKIPTRLHDPGFTLVELLVVMALVAVLIAMLLPSLESARDVARNTLCKANMKQLASAGVNYRSDWQVYLPFFQSQTDDPNCNDETTPGTYPHRFGNSGIACLYAGNYMMFPVGYYSSSPTNSLSGVLDGARRRSVNLCPSGRYLGPPQARGAMAYVIHPGPDGALDPITRTQDGYDVSRAGTKIQPLGTVEALRSLIQSYSINSRFGISVDVPGVTTRVGTSALKSLPATVPEHNLLVWTEFFNRDGLDHGYRVSMSFLRGTSSESSMPRYGYYRTPHNALKTGNWAALDGHVAEIKIAQLQAAHAASTTALAAKELPFEF